MLTFDLGKISELHDAPKSLLQEMSKKTLYMLQKPPEQSDVYSFYNLPQHIVDDYGLTKQNQTEFLFDSSNFTQNAREQIVVWNYTYLLKKIVNEDNHYAIIVPQEDRGVDCYLRIIPGPDPDNLTTIPIQVTEIRSDENEGDYLVRLSDQQTSGELERTILEKVKAAKGGRRQDGVTLLCSLKITISGEINIFKLRHLFSNADINWGYSKIILISSGREKGFLSTIWCSEDHDYFEIIRQDDESRFMIGETESDRQENANQKNVNFTI